MRNTQDEHRTSLDFMTETKRTPSVPLEVPKARATASLQSSNALGVVFPASELNGQI